MRTYTIYYFDDTGRICTSATMQCATDAEAMQKAHRSMEDKFVSLQIFEDERLVSAHAQKTTGDVAGAQARGEVSASVSADQVMLREQRDMLVDSLARFEQGAAAIGALSPHSYMTVGSMDQISSLRRVVEQLNRVIAA